MRYRSTRGQSQGLSFEEAVLEGLAPDGGLFIPHEIPQIPASEIESWRGLLFHELAFEIFRKFISNQEINDDDLQLLLKKSFSSFTNEMVTPVIQLPAMTNSPSEQKYDFHVLELWHGPTFAFKDVALQCLGNLFEFFLARKNASREDGKPMRITVVGATSGDTGGAAIYGLKGKTNLDVFILHPKNRISSIQEAQMTSVLDPNVHNIAVEGTFDDCQEIVKTLFSDKKFNGKYHLGAINSINWARILAQTVYYFSSYFQITQSIDTKVQYVVPTGNFGDVLAGYYALRMGLPISKLVVATNDNDILHRFFETGKYEKSANPAVEPLVHQTLSPAMDILVSSNFERLMWYLVRGDGTQSNLNATAHHEELACNQIAAWMSDLKTKGGFSVDKDLLTRAKSVFGSHKVTNCETSDCIQRYYHSFYKSKSSGKPYVLDPHTAVGIVAAEIHSDASSPTICLATASPGKFPEAVMNAINNVDKEIGLESTRNGFKPIEFKDFAPVPLVELKGRPKRCSFVSTDGDKTKGIEGVKIIIESTINI